MTGHHGARSSFRRVVQAAILSCLVSAVVLAAEEPNKKPNPDAGAKWKKLFDGKTLKGWKVVEFGGDGEVKVKDGALVLARGVQLTGVTWNGEKLPSMNYEISLEAQRVEGDDFFCGLTFPVGKSPCSFIVGGWGGAVVGLSSIDGLDASENETTKYLTFRSKQWYPIRIRVTQKNIAAWIGEKKVADVKTAGRKISIRPEVELSLPLGFTSWQTTAALRNIKIRSLPAGPNKPSKPK
ncbi:MAG: DUF1080 domain-containing protein [Planctomycetales bacterium]